MLPGRQAGLACDVLEKDGALLDEAAGGDGTAFAVEHSRVSTSGVDSSNGGSLAAFTRLVGLRIGSMGVRRGGLRGATAGACDRHGAEHDCGKPEDGRRPGSELNSVIP